MYLSDNWQDYALLDAGGGNKLERWGSVVLLRPDPQAIWPIALWPAAELSPVCDAVYNRSASGGGAWTFHRQLPESWKMGYRDLTFIVRPTGFKHTGLFPEQAVNWDWMRGRLDAWQAEYADRAPKVLNLFAYTGAATCACAKAGANVVHVDAAKGMVAWAKENAAACNLADAPIRYIVDDCAAFVRREIRRGNRYDGILMDPPSYGRGPMGEMWRMEDNLYALVSDCAQLLSDTPAFFLINSYTTGLAPAVLRNILQLALPPGQAEADEVGLPFSAEGKRAGLVLPCGASGRWE
ncbi:MAG: class I SAM-dependent methyltransferase [Clostridiales bacterium]|nr:class I SAM-dependent methyltransferase [Clostridiales bacterium]